MIGLVQFYSRRVHGPIVSESGLRPVYFLDRLHSSGMAKVD